MTAFSNHTCPYEIQYSHRHLSLLNDFSKVSVFAMHNHLSYYCTRKLDSSEHGFIQSKSITSLVSYLDFISPLDWLQRHAVIHHHHHHVPEGLGVFPVPWSSRWSWSLHLFLGRPMFLRPFGLYCSACFGSLFVSILCTCCSHFWFIL